MKLFRCIRCLYPNTKPDLHFDADGLCSACQAFDKRKEIDWKAREREFVELIHANRGKSHDVIVACSGGKDSTAQVVKCISLGLKPLAVTATTDHLSQIGRHNLDNISRLCDHIEVTPHKPTRNKIARFALEEVGDISWCEHHLIWSVPAREAVVRGIPIVLYGECPQNEYGAGPAGSEKQEQLTQPWIHEFGGLLGLRLSDMSDLLDIDPRHLEVYRYPEGDVQALFMGAYFPWSGSENYNVAREHGFTSYTSHVEGSLFRYENLDNLQTGLHDRLRYLKFGYSRATDIASNYIRRGRITRPEGVGLVQERERNWPQTYLGVSYEEILANIGMTVDEFDKVCVRFMNQKVLEWASNPESYRHFYGTSTAASKVRSFRRSAPSAA
jgi:N-acetyl sugar amidotransferase